MLLQVIMRFWLSSHNARRTGFGQDGNARVWLDGEYQVVIAAVYLRSSGNFSRLVWPLVYFRPTHYSGQSQVSQVAPVTACTLSHTWTQRNIETQ